MADNSINLLPKELEIRSSSSKTFKRLNMISTALGVILILSIIASITGIFFLTRTRNALADQRKFLSDNITALESTEKNLAITKDRMEKAQQILAMRNLEKRLDNQADIVLETSPNTSFVSTQLSADTSTLTVSSPNSSSLQVLFDKLSLGVEDLTITSASIQGLRFNPFQGFNVVLQIL